MAAKKKKPAPVPEPEPVEEEETSVLEDLDAIDELLDLDDLEMEETTQETIHDVAQEESTSAGQSLQTTYDQYRKLIFLVDTSGSMGADIPVSVVNPERRSKAQVARETLSQAIKDRFFAVKNADVSLVEFDVHQRVIKWQVKEDLIHYVENNMLFGGGGTDIYGAIERCLTLCQRSPSPVDIHNIVLITDGLDDGSPQRIVDKLAPQLKEKNIILDLLLIVSEGTPEMPDEDDDEMDEIDALTGEPIEKEPKEPKEPKGVVLAPEMNYEIESFMLLKAACAEAGGRFVLVRTAEDVKNKFLEAAQRLCLPAPEKK